MKHTSDLSIRARLFRGYGPLAAGLVSVLVVTALVPSRVPEVEVVAEAPPPEVLGTTTVPAAVDPESTVPEGGEVVEPGGDPTSPDAVGPGSVGGDGTTPRSTAKPLSSPTTVPAAAGCTGGDRLVKAQYSPRCRPWTPGADNEGATARGVTKDRIVVAVRQNQYVGELLNLFADTASRGELRESATRTLETLDALVEHFNRTYHFYGRKLTLARYDGRGRVQKELFGSGSAEAQADAVQVADGIGAFADISANSMPYSEALSAKDVVNFGVPYPSRSWLQARNRRAWATEADCSTIAEAVSSYYVRRLAGRAAGQAGEELAGRTRSLAIVYPGNSTYGDCAQQAVAALEGAGLGADIVSREEYQLNFDRIPSQAASLAPKIMSRQPTTVVCACDPVMIMLLAGQMEQQRYRPEWISTGVAYIDQDLVGQLMPKEQWKRAFGISFAGSSATQGGSEALRAFRSIRPNGTPSIALEAIYYQLQLLAIGVMEAGPRLTPDSFANGMVQFPRSSGRAGTWAFEPGDFSTAEDAREIHWSPTARSSQNGLPGAWVEGEGGKRFAIGAWPGSEPTYLR